LCSYVLVTFLNWPYIWSADCIATLHLLIFRTLYL
jgi:hypothetical protein